MKRPALRKLWPTLLKYRKYRRYSINTYSVYKALYNKNKAAELSVACFLKFSSLASAAAVVVTAASAVV